MNRKINRRVFLKLAAASGLTVALGDALITSAPWLDYDKQARRTWAVPFREEASQSAQMLDLIRYATLAPSGHNTQPWNFSAQGDTIRILPDYARRLPAVDPQDRELWISLGCALENTLIAAQVAGYGADVAYPAPGADFISVRLSRLPARVPVPLFEAIPHRQNNRSLYDGKPIPPADMKRIEAVPCGAGVSTLVFTDSSRVSG